MLQQETIVHHEHVTVMPESRTATLRPGMLEDIALMLGRQFAVYNAACRGPGGKAGDPLADLKALELVMEFDALPTGQLAQLMGISSGGATALINRRKGLAMCNAVAIPGPPDDRDPAGRGNLPDAGPGTAVDHGASRHAGAPL